MLSLKPLNTVKHLLPENCMALDFSSHRNVEDLILFCEGDLKVDMLDLDAPLALCDTASVIETFANQPVQDKDCELEWYGDDGYLCRLPPHPEPRVSVTRETDTLDIDGDPGLCHYLFMIIQDREDNKSVDFSFQPSQEKYGGGE